MSKSARTKRQHAAVPPVGKQRVQARTVWLATAGGALIVAIVAGILVATRPGSSTPKAAPLTAADRDAPASLVNAADAVGFHPTTEPGVGLIEERPASAAQPASNPDLLAVGTKAPAFTLQTPQGQSISLSSYRGKAVLLESSRRGVRTATQRHRILPSSLAPFRSSASGSSPSTQTARRRRASSRFIATTGFRIPHSSTRATSREASTPREPPARSRPHTESSRSRRST